jgi:hypothetical protein
MTKREGSPRGRILTLGDCHGNFNAVHQALLQGKNAGCIAAIQVGDFGFFPGELERFMPSIGRWPLPLHVIDGNHEDHEWLHRQRAHRRGEVLRQWTTDWDLHYHPRGTVTELCGWRVAWCGGAAHADRPQEYAARPSLNRRGPPPAPKWSSWVSQADVRRTLAAIGDHPIDLMVTHSCPYGLGIGMTGSDFMIPGVMKHIFKFGFEIGPERDFGEQHLTELWHSLFNKPPLWIFGHWHVLHGVQVGTTYFSCRGTTDLRNFVPSDMFGIDDRGGIPVIVGTGWMPP